MKMSKYENLIIFVTVFTVAIAAGYYLNFKLNLIFGDALVRSFHAYLVFFGNEPKLSAIGFVWPPLQTILQLPLVLVPFLNINGFAGNVASAVFFGISTVYLNLLSRLFNVHRFFRYSVIFLFVSNPLIFYYGANGMSEIIGISFILMTLYYFLRHLKTQSIPSVILASLALACSVMTRWETGLLLFVALFILAINPWFNKKYSFREAESSIVMFLLPIGFAVVLWLIASWLIVGSPIYFLHSRYSFTEQDVKNIASYSDLSSVKGSVSGALQFALERIALLSTLFVPFLILSLYKLREKENRIYLLTLLGFAFCVVISQTLPIYFGKSYGQLRYYIYVIPFCSIFLSYLFEDTLQITLKNRLVILMFIISAIAVLDSAGLTIQAMSKYGSREEYSIANLILHNDQSYTNEAYAKEQKIAGYLTSHVDSRSILLDDGLGFNIVYLTKKPSLFIESVDSDFEETLKNPVNSQAKYILLTNPKKTAGIDAVSIFYPQMFESGADFVTLEEDFVEWRLYKINTGEDKAAEKHGTKQVKVNCEQLVAGGESRWKIANKYQVAGKDDQKSRRFTKA